MNYKDTMLDIYSDGGDWEDFEPEIDKVELRIAQLEAQLAEAVEVIKCGESLVLKMHEVYDDLQYQTAFQLLADHQGNYTGKQWTNEQDEFSVRAAEFLKKLEDTPA